MIIQEIEKLKIIDLYVKNDKTMSNIAGIFNINKKTVSKIIKSNGIKVKRHKRIYSFFYDQKLSQKQREILTGTLLGDGCIDKHHEGINSCRYVETHSVDQIDYALWKFNEFKNFISNNYRIVTKKYEKSYSGSKPSIVFETMLNKEFVEFYNNFYPNDIKIVPDNIESILTPLGLAIWYMDDGSVHYVSKKAVARFSTYSFCCNHIKILENAIKNKFDLHSTRINTEKGIVMQLCQNETKKMIEIIKEHILPSMLYKINLIYNPAETEA